jgi:outer membrane protein assembly factor BamE
MGITLQDMLFHLAILKRPFRLVIPLLLAMLSACVYRIDVQQGNLLEDHDIEAVELGMTRSQVRFLLGTPVVEDTFHRERWDYIYYFRQGRRPEADRSWLIVYFDGDRVSEVLKDVTTEPS